MTALRRFRDRQRRGVWANVHAGLPAHRHQADAIHRSRAVIDAASMRAAHGSNNGPQPRRSRKNGEAAPCGRGRGDRVERTRREAIAPPRGSHSTGTGQARSAATSPPRACKGIARAIPNRIGVPCGDWASSRSWPNARPNLQAAEENTLGSLSVRRPGCIRFADAVSVTKAATTSTKHC